MQRKPAPEASNLSQWHLEAEREAKKFIASNLMGGHPAITSAILQAYIQGYIRGRTHQWRIEQELAVFRESLDKAID